MKKVKIDRIFNVNGCVSAQAMMLYHAGGLSASESEQIEQHLASCEFCREALEGAGMTESPASYNESIRSMKSQWYGGRKKKRAESISRVLYPAFAVIAACFILYVGISNVLRRKGFFADENLLVYESGTPIDSAVAAPENVFVPAEASEIKVTEEKEIKVRKEYKKNTVIIHEEKIPVALLDETRIVANQTDTAVETTRIIADKVENDPVQLTYPFRVITMPPPEHSGTTFVMVDKMPGFMGQGLQKFYRYVHQRLRYPDAAINKEISGKVLVQFTVDENGNVTNVILLKKVHPLLDAEVLRVIANTPRWTPGKNKNRPVKVAMVMPVDFVLY